MQKNIKNIENININISGEKIEIKVNQLNNYYIFCENIYFSITGLLLIFSQRNNFTSSFFSNLLELGKNGAAPILLQGS